MFPGLTTRISEQKLASAATLVPSADLVRLTGTTSIATIVPPYGGSAGLVILAPLDGNVATTTTGNIAVAVTIPQSRSAIMVYSAVDNKWYPGAIN
jgi:hypothetical protein